MPALDIPDYWTAEMVRALPEVGKRYETVHGELFVSAAPRVWHQVVVDRLHTALKQYLRPDTTQMAMTGDADISWAPDVLVQPDIYVAPRDEIRTLDWAQIRSLSLVAEVISPSSQRTDRFPKRRLYQEVGVPLYWVVEADDRYVEVWTPQTMFPVIERERVTWRADGADVDFVIELVELFAAL